MIVEDGTIVEGANSYAEVEDADEYWDERGNTAWAALTEEQKEICLVKATDYIEQVYGQSFVGSLTDQDQPLSWPREDAVVNGFEVDEDEIPTLLVKLTLLLADKARTTTLLPDLAANSGSVISESISAGPVSRSKSYASPARQHPYFPDVVALIRPLLRSGGGGRLVRS